MIGRRSVAATGPRAGPDARAWSVRVTTNGPQITAMVAAGVAAAWVATLLVRRLEGLGTGAYDLGFFQQVIWNVSTSGTWASSFHDGSFLGLHFSPILIVPAAIQGVVGGDARFLSLLHALGIGALVPATFVFLRAAFRPSPLAAALAIGVAIWIPVWATMQWVIRSDFHPELFGVVLALLTGWAGLSGRARMMWVLACVALTTREDAAYAIAVIGLVVAARGRGRMRTHGRALAAVAVVCGVVVFLVLMPWIRHGLPSDTAHYYRWLGEGASVLTAPFRLPDRMVAALTMPDSWFLVAGIVIALAGLPLLRPQWLLLLVPPLAALLLSSHPPQAAVVLQYPLVLIVPFMVAAAMGGRRLLAIAGRIRRRRRTSRGRSGGSAGTNRLARSAAPLLFVLVTTPALLGAWVQGTIPPFVGNDPTFLDRPAAIDRLRAIAATVPLDAPLVADEGLITALAARPSIRRLAGSWLPRSQAYVIIDRQAWSPTTGAAMERDLIAARLPLSGRPMLADDGRFVVWGPRSLGAAP
jgi:uncharacterized membrane protein